MYKRFTPQKQSSDNYSSNSLKYRAVLSPNNLNIDYGNRYDTRMLKNYSSANLQPNSSLDLEKYHENKLQMTARGHYFSQNVQGLRSDAKYGQNRILYGSGTNSRPFFKHRPQPQSSKEMLSAEIFTKTSDDSFGLKNSQILKSQTSKSRFTNIVQHEGYSTGFKKRQAPQFVSETESQYFTQNYDSNGLKSQLRSPNELFPYGKQLNTRLATTGEFSKIRNNVEDLDSTLVKSTQHLFLKDEDQSQHKSGQFTPLSKETILEESDCDKSQLTREINSRFDNLMKEIESLSQTISKFNQKKNTSKLLKDTKSYEQMDDRSGRISVETNQMECQSEQFAPRNFQTFEEHDTDRMRLAVPREHKFSKKLEKVKESLRKGESDRISNSKSKLSFQDRNTPSFKEDNYKNRKLSAHTQNNFQQISSNSSQTGNTENKFALNVTPKPQGTPTKSREIQDFTQSEAKIRKYEEYGEIINLKPSPSSMVIQRPKDLPPTIRTINRQIPSLKKMDAGADSDRIEQYQNSERQNSAAQLQSNLPRSGEHSNKLLRQYNGTSSSKIGFEGQAPSIRVRDTEIVDPSSKKHSALKSANQTSTYNAEKHSFQSSKDSFISSQLTDQKSLKIDTMSPEELFKLKQKIDKKIQEFQNQQKSQPSTETVLKNSQFGVHNRVDHTALTVQNTSQNKLLMNDTFPFRDSQILTLSKDSLTDMDNFTVNQTYIDSDVSILEIKKNIEQMRKGLLSGSKINIEENILDGITY